MKKLLTLIALLFVVTLSQAQYSQTGANTILTQSEQYITNSPTSVVGNRVNMLILKDSTRWENRWRGVFWTKYTDSKNDGLPSGLLWTGTDGAMKHSPMSEVRLDWSQILSKPSFFSGNYDDLTNKPSLFSGAYADLTGKPTLFSGAYSDLTGKPSLFSGSYNDLSNRPTLFSGSYNDLTNKPAIPIGMSLATTGTGPATYNSSTGVLNVPNYTYTPVARVYNNNVSRTLNSNYTISTTRDSRVNYSISISVTNPLIAGSSTATAFLEYSTDGGTNWITVSQVVNASSVGVAVAIAITQPNTFVLSGDIPANALVRIRTTVAGTATATYTRGQEVLE